MVRCDSDGPIAELVRRSSRLALDGPAEHGSRFVHSGEQRARAGAHADDDTVNAAGIVPRHADHERRVLRLHDGASRQGGQDFLGRALPQRTAPSIFPFHSGEVSVPAQWSVPTGVRSTGPYAVHSPSVQQPP